MRWSIRQSVTALLSLWAAAVGLSFAGFAAQWGTLPASEDALVGATLLAALALPAGFAATLGLAVPASQVIFVAVVYWPVVFFMHYQFLRRRRPELCAGVAVVVLISAWKWQVIAHGLIGI